MAVTLRAASRGIYLVNSPNRFEACRFGYAGEMVDPYGGPKKRMQADILDTLAIVAAHASALGSGELLEELERLVRAGDSDADWLRALERVSADLVFVIEARGP